MDTYGDVIGVVAVLVMVRVGWSLARAAWREGTQPRPDLALDDLLLDLRGNSPRDPAG